MSRNPDQIFSWKAYMHDSSGHKLQCSISYNIVGIHRKIQHTEKKPTKEFTQSSWENSKARLHREMNRGELEKKKKTKTKEKVWRTTPL